MAKIKITGSLVQAYMICKRQAWLMSRHLTGNQSNDFLKIGRLLSETSFQGNKKGLRIKRSKRPPEDHINSLISFANSIIYTYVLGEIYQTHLDPRIGFLHATNLRRFSLNLDIAEIFKPVIGDRTIFQCLNKKIISKSDFENKLNGLVLKEAGRRKFLEQLEDKLKQTIKHYKLDKEVSYRRLIRLELYKLEKHLMEEEPYQPFVMEW
jgi:CRISPR-associated protein Cas1